MNLIQFRIRCHRNLSDSHWKEVKEGINVLGLKDPNASRAILEYLSTIRPLTAGSLRHLQDSAGLSYREGAHTRRVIPHKKTAAITVFTADPPLVKILAELDSDLFETDRIEVGRRLDHSRWMNFVEIPSSSRWKEIKPIVNRLLTHLAGHKTGLDLSSLRELISPLKDTDRMRRGLDERLLDAMHPIAPQVPSPLEKEYTEAIKLIQRNQRFSRAKEKVFKALPYFILLTPVKRTGQKDLHQSITLLVREAANKSQLLQQDKSVILIDCTTASADDISSTCSILEETPSQCSIVAVPPRQVEHLSDKYRIMKP